jgi:multidrug resistance efflux pump
MVIIILTFLWVWQPWGEDPEQPRKGPATTKVLLQSVVHTILATGKVMPQVGAEVNVGSRVSGRLDKLYVNVGDAVVKEQIIAEIEKEDLEATKAEKEAEVALIEARLRTLKREGPQEIAQKEAELAERKAKLKFARRKLGRDDQLLDKALISNEEWEESSSDFKVAQAQHEAARRGLQLANTRIDEGLKQLDAELLRVRASLKNALVKLSYAQIRAPLSGVVGSVSTHEGETVAAGLSAPTFVTIVDLTRLQLDAYVDEVDIGRIKVGQKGFFSVDAFPGKEFQGRVTAIYPQAVIQNDVVTYDCIISIDTPYAGLLRPKMTATVTIIVENKENVLVLPVGTVKRRAGKDVVWRRRGDRIEEVSVTTGWQDDTRVEILSGLSQGEVILTSPPKDFKGAGKQ